MKKTGRRIFRIIATIAIIIVVLAAAFVLLHKFYPKSDSVDEPETQTSETVSIYGTWWSDSEEAEFLLDISEEGVKLVGSQEENEFVELECFVFYSDVGAGLKLCLFMEGMPFYAILSNDGSTLLLFSGGEALIFYRVTDELPSGKEKPGKSPEEALLEMYFSESTYAGGNENRYSFTPHADGSVTFTIDGEDAETVEKESVSIKHDEYNAPYFKITADSATYYLKPNIYGLNLYVDGLGSGNWAGLLTMSEAEPSGQAAI